MADPRFEPKGFSLISSQGHVPDVTGYTMKCLPGYTSPNACEGIWAARGQDVRESWGVSGKRETGGGLGKNSDYIVNVAGRAHQSVEVGSVV